MLNVQPSWYHCLNPAKVVHNQIKSTQLPHQLKKHRYKITNHQNNQPLIKIKNSRQRKLDPA